MVILFNLLAIYGLYFLLVQSDGPFGILNWARNILMRNKYLGVFFYKLFLCSFCSGCHVGWMIYLLSNPPKDWSLNLLICWILTGGTTCLIIDTWLARLQNPPSNS